MPEKPSAFTVSLVIAAVTGAGTACQAGVNSFLAQSLRAAGDKEVASACSQATSSVLLASLVSFAGGLLMVVVLIAVQLGGKTCKQKELKLGWPKTFLELCGGLLGFANLTSRLFVLPILGVALSSIMVSVGQMVASLIQDQMGILGAPVVKITGYRVVGALLLVAGGVLSVASELTHGPNASAAPVTLLLALIPLGAGYIGTLQAAINFKLAKSVGMPLLATFTSFAVATLCVGSSVAACGLPYDAGPTLSGMPIWAFRRSPRARARVPVAVLT
jgi:uncharacterized membrane protein YdcZ (DUF606 family)